MYQARFWESVEDQKVQCYLCAHECKIDPGKRGLCHVRENQDGTLYSLNYGKSHCRAHRPHREKAPVPLPAGHPVLLHRHHGLQLHVPPLPEL